MELGVPGSGDHFAYVSVYISSAAAVSSSMWYRVDSLKVDASVVCKD